MRRTVGRLMDVEEAFSTMPEINVEFQYFPRAEIPCI